MYLIINYRNKGGRIEPPSKYSEYLKLTCEELSLIDILKVRNPTLKDLHIEKTLN